jgi:hypothetical protein
LNTPDEPKGFVIVIVFDAITHVPDARVKVSVQEDYDVRDIEEGNVIVIFDDDWM